MISESVLMHILDEVDYKDWLFSYRPVEGGGFLLWVSFEDEGEKWNGRKWYVSGHSTESEVVQTCLKAILRAEEHEAREKFFYAGRAVFGPHLSIAALHAVAEDVEVRA